jgi:hypothetical protein
VVFCLELMPTAEAQDKLVLLSVEGKGVASPLPTYELCVHTEMNWRVKARFAERIRMVAARIYREASGG